MNSIISIAYTSITMSQTRTMYMNVNDNFFSLMTSLYWGCMKGYTYTSMYFNKYAVPTINNLVSRFTKPDEEFLYPFRLIRENKLVQVYYPDIRPTNYKFIQVLVEVNGEKHILNMDEFMVIDNCLFYDEFVQWILYEQLEESISLDDEYQIQIIDNNANLHKITNNEYVVLEADTFRVEKKEHDTNEDM